MEESQGYYVILKNGEKVYYKRLCNASKRYHKEYDGVFQPKTFFPFGESLQHYMEHIVSQAEIDCHKYFEERLSKIFRELEDEIKQE